MTPLTFTVDGPPKAWQRAVAGKGGHIFTPPETRAYQKRIKVLAFVAIRKHTEWPEATALPITLTLDVYFPDAHRRDLDNVIKSCCDACNEVVWRDDSQVTELHVYRHIEKKCPRVEFQVTLWTSDEETHRL